MSKMFLIDLNDINSLFENFNWFIKDYENWSYEHNQIPFERLKHNDAYAELEYFELSDYVYDNKDVFDCFEELEELKTNDFEDITIFLIPDINFFTNKDEIRNYLKSDNQFNYLEFVIETDDTSEIEKLETFILEHCKIN